MTEVGIKNAISLVITGCYFHLILIWVLRQSVIIFSVPIGLLRYACAGIIIIQFYTNPIFYGSMVFKTKRMEKSSKL